MTTYTLNFQELTSFITKLPKRMNKASAALLNASAKSLQKGIRTNAPQGQTGSLKQTKVKRKGGKQIQILGPGHAHFVNRGLSPKKMIPVEFAEGHIGNPGSTAGKTAWIDNPKGFFYANYTGGKGFIDRSISNFQKRAPAIFKKELNKIMAP